MIKYLMIFCILLSGCSAGPQVGECYKSNIFNVIDKIVMVNKKTVQVEYTFPDVSKTWVKFDWKKMELFVIETELFMNSYEKINCPY